MVTLAVIILNTTLREIKGLFSGKRKICYIQGPDFSKKYEGKIIHWIDSYKAMNSKHKIKSGAY